VEKKIVTFGGDGKKVVNQRCRWFGRYGIFRRYYLDCSRVEFERYMLGATKRGEEGGVR